MIREDHGDDSMHHGDGGSAGWRDHEASDPAPATRTGSSMSSGGNGRARLAAGDGPISFDPAGGGWRPRRVRIGTGVPTGGRSAPLRPPKMRSRGSALCSMRRTIRSTCRDSFGRGPARTDDFLSPAATGASDACNTMDDPAATSTSAGHMASSASTFNSRYGRTRKKSNDSAAVTVATAAAFGPASAAAAPIKQDECGHGKAGGVRLAAQPRHHGRRGEWPEHGDTPTRCQLDVVAHPLRGLAPRRVRRGLVDTRFTRGD